MTTEDNPEDSYVTPLAKAIAIWRSGRNITFDLAVALLEEGYDVQSLEARHRVFN